jgi:hypothetical protein
MVGWHRRDSKVRDILVVNRHDLFHALCAITQTSADLETYQRSGRYLGLNELSRLKDFIFEGFHDNIPFGEKIRAYLRTDNEYQSNRNWLLDWL